MTNLHGLTTSFGGLALVGALVAGVPAELSGTCCPGAQIVPDNSARPDPLANLDHLDWLGDTVTPPEQEGHTTYRLGRDPSIGVVWTYADRQADGTYRRIGGGTYDAATDTYGQGAFNADDMTRASVVYLRHWRQTGSDGSRDRARELLRGVTYLQTATGPNAGNVVLWMQPDGTLNPSAEPVEQPDPSDSGESYWLARTIWALSEGYAAFRHADPAFAAFLRERLELAVGALERQTLSRYGDYLDIDGERTPAWLVVDGADASAEAMLGLAAYVRAGGSATARTALRQLAEGVAGVAGDRLDQWPFGGVRPWALSRSVWHAWASQMPAALADAASVLRQADLARVAARDSFGFDPWLLTSGGPDNGRLPSRGDGTQIAYGVDSRLQSLLATGDATGRDAATRQLAGLVAAWYFGANPAGEPMYDPVTGRTYDGIAPDGTINRNSGAESTIHGLLSMLALDAHPAVAALAGTDAIVDRVGDQTLEAEAARLSGDATVVTPEALWTGESLYSGTGYAAIGDGGEATFALPPHGPVFVVPVVDLRPGSTAVTAFAAGQRSLGSVDSGAVGTQGDSPAPGALLPTRLGTPIGADIDTVTAHTTQLSAPYDAGASHRADNSDNVARLDALWLQPIVSRLVVAGGDHGVALLANAAATGQTASVSVPGRGRITVTTYDALGRVVDRETSGGDAVSVTLPAHGFAIARR